MVGSARLSIREEGVLGEFALDVLEDGRRVGSAIYTESSTQVLVMHIGVLEEYRHRGYGSLMVMFLIGESEQLGIPLRVWRLTGPGKQFFDAMQRRGLITIEEAQDTNFLEYELRRAP